MGGNKRKKDERKKQEKTLEKHFSYGEKQQDLEHKDFIEFLNETNQIKDCSLI